MKERKAGKLYIVATPIGNLEDITLRALRMLREVDVIAAEDTRQTVKLLNHYDIKKPLISFHEHSTKGRQEQIIARLHAGQSVALVSDAGTPLISDPGAALTRQCVREGMDVESLPGACAAITAYTLCGFEEGPFAFYGFLDAKASARKKQLACLKEKGMACILYESPARVKKTLADICEVLGADAEVFVARELTKLHEEKIRGNAGQVLEALASREQVRGEFVIIVCPENKPAEVGEGEVRRQLGACLEKGMSKKAAAQYVSQQLGVSKNAVYKMAIGLTDQGE